MAMNADSDATQERMIRRQPLPLAQLYWRARNATTSEGRHNAAWYLWEAALKLLGSVAIVTYAERDRHDSKRVETLRLLERPTLGHWWRFVRELVQDLAGDGDEGFQAVRDVL